GQVYDVHEAHYRRREIEVADDRVARLVERGRPAPGDQVIDVDGAFLLPGFIDCHAHLCMPTEAGNPDNPWRSSLPGDIAIYAAEAAKRTLLGGITTARDVGGWDYHEIAVRNAINRGRILGPRLFCAGRLLSITTATVSYYPGMYEVADGPEAVRSAARKQLAHGADLIKVMATGALTSSEYEDPRAIQYTLEEITAAVAIAAENYKHCAAHAHALDGIRNAALAGCRSVEHGSFGDEATYAVMAERGTYLVPTCCVTSAMLADNAVAAAVPAHVHKRYLEFDDIHLRNVELARLTGVTIAMGTDAGTPGNHHGANTQELVSMVRRTGMSAHEAVVASTISAARLLGREADLGSLEVGRFADVVGFAEDPLARIEVVRDVRFVAKGGAVARDDLRALS
ncbi:MAG: amidohydrolase family protein, partial [Alphaproteobacteria bacterium]